MTKHINLPDEHGQVYCCLRNRVVRYEQDHCRRFCSGCRMFGGAADGGVVCIWEENRPGCPEEIRVTDPVEAWMGNQKKRVQTLITQWEAMGRGPVYEPCGDSEGAAV